MGSPAVEVATVSPPSSTTTSSDTQAQDEGQPPTGSAQSKDRITVPSACIQCRSKHLKCDGLTPCTRCSSNSFECLYVKSKRGFKGPRKISQKQSDISPPAQPTIRACPLVNPKAAKASSNFSSGLATPPDVRQIPLVSAATVSPLGISQELVAYDSNNLHSGLDLGERCIEAFYFHFYPAHVSPGMSE
jgi:hypothetical protein